VADDGPGVHAAGSGDVSPLAYVPQSGDRILPDRPAAAVPYRIEPTFDTPAQAAESLQIDAGRAASADAAEKTPPDTAVNAAGAQTAAKAAGLLSGPWTWRRALRLAGLAVAAYFATVLFLIVVYRFINPPITTLIAYQWLTGTKIEQDWVPIEDISSNLLRAVVVSEDWGFCDHYGVDIEAIEKALEQAGEGKIARGASTISMQVIKNLFLSQSKSYLRKAVEIPLTVAAEAVWPKSRMLEIYLNIAEWGPGVFGAEAAARHHFNKPASRLSEREAALLAAALPNPILRDAGDPSTRTARKASVIQARMRAAGPEVADCAMAGRQRPARTERNDQRPADWQTTVKKRAGADGGL
jgi:monofunctional biosynthetic peptidoglycan transglycosylase